MAVCLFGDQSPDCLCVKWHTAFACNTSTYLGIEPRNCTFYPTTDPRPLLAFLTLRLELIIGPGWLLTPPSSPEPSEAKGRVFTTHTGKSVSQESKVTLARRNSALSHTLKRSEAGSRKQGSLFMGASLGLDKHAPRVPCLLGTDNFTMCITDNFTRLHYLMWAQRLMVVSNFNI